MGLREYQGEASNLSGELLAGWLLANPNGPTAFALGIVALEGSLRLLYRWMHFTGGKTWLSQNLGAELGDGNFGEALFNLLVLIENDALASGKDVRFVPSIPSCVILNGNPQVSAAFASLLTISLEFDHNWGRELYYLDKYGSDFFSRYEEEYRDIYERLKRDPNVAPEALQWLWLSHSHRKGFQDWQPNRYRNSDLTPELFARWYAQVTDPRFVSEAAYWFAQMWVGSSFVAEQTGHLARLKEAGMFESLSDTLRFFESFNRPLLPPDIDEGAIRSGMNL